MEEENDSFQPGTLNKIEEETDWEEEEDGEEEDDDEEEMREGVHHVGYGDPFPFPVLAPPEEFQNCLSPSAMYDVSLSTYHQQRTSPNSVTVRHRSTSSTAPLTSSASSSLGYSSSSASRTSDKESASSRREVSQRSGGGGAVVSGGAAQGGGGSSVVRSTVSSPAYSQDSGGHWCM